MPVRKTGNSSPKRGPPHLCLARSSAQKHGAIRAASAGNSAATHGRCHCVHSSAVVAARERGPGIVRAHTQIRVGAPAASIACRELESTGDLPHISESPG